MQTLYIIGNGFDSRLKYVLKKDTKSALERNVVFFNKLSGINKI